MPSLITQLAALESTVTTSERFEPASSSMHWRLSLSDLGEMMFRHVLPRPASANAARCQVSNVAVDATRVASALEAHDIDLAVGILSTGAESVAGGCCSKSTSSASQRTTGPQA